MRSQDMSDEEILRLGLEIYERKLKPLLEPHRNGAQAAICVDGEDYEVADDIFQADARLRERHPDAVFLHVQVGKPVMEWPWTRMTSDASGKP